MYNMRLYAQVDMEADLFSFYLHEYFRFTDCSLNLIVGKKVTRYTFYQISIFFCLQDISNKIVLVFTYFSHINNPQI